MANKHHQIIIIGAGTAGITVAARLHKADKSLDIAIVDPAETHYYQPAYTLVAADTFDFNKTGRPMASLIPKGVNWIKQAVTEGDTVHNLLILNNGDHLNYDYLVACPGIQIDLNGTPGLEEAFKKDQVCSIYVGESSRSSAQIQRRDGSIYYSTHAYKMWRYDQCIAVNDPGSSAGYDHDLQRQYSDGECSGEPGGD